MSLRDQLQSIYDSHGKLTPAIVLDEAKAPAHPLHERFEWDDSTAANAYRLSQAHELIRSVKVVYREATETEREKSVRAFHAVRTEEGYVYEPAVKVVEDPFLRDLLLKDMQREWAALRRRFHEFQEFWDMVSRDASSEAA